MSAVKPPKPRATYDDLLQVPEPMVAEILGGELYASPRPAFPHARVASALSGELWGPYDRGRGGPGGWWILYEPELHFGEDVLVPDLAGWRRERLPGIPASPWITLPPDWVCEVVSPSTERVDRAKKLPIYTREGVSYVWLINPEAKTLEVYRRSGTAWTLIATHGGDDVLRAEPFEAIELDLLTLWGESRPPAGS